MPIGPNGERRPSNPIEAGIMAARVAAGDIPEEYVEEKKSIPKRSKGGKKGGNARAETLSLERRSEIASAAAKARWEKEEEA